jgi:NADH dehydrogenase (ubiquinone) Fe-S protein 3
MKLQQKYFGDFSDFVPVLSVEDIKKEIVVVVLPEQVRYVLCFLKYHIGSQHNTLSCISGVDFLGKKFRFAVCYELLSLRFNSRVRVKVFLNEVTPLLSAVEVFVNANWWEREIWDLYGIFFEKHPDLRRILTDYGAEGAPLRKDFPLYGFVELRYDESQKRIVVEPIEFSQEFRSFDFQTPW